MFFVSVGKEPMAIESYTLSGFLEILEQSKNPERVQSLLAVGFLPMENEDKCQIVKNILSHFDN